MDCAIVAGSHMIAHQFNRCLSCRTTAIIQCMDQPLDTAGSVVRMYWWIIPHWGFALPTQQTSGGRRGRNAVELLLLPCTCLVSMVRQDCSLRVGWVFALALPVALRFRWDIGFCLRGLVGYCIAVPGWMCSWDYAGSVPFHLWVSVELTGVPP